MITKEKFLANIKLAARKKRFIENVELFAEQHDDYPSFVTSVRMMFSPEGVMSSLEFRTVIKSVAQKAKLI